MDCGSAEGQPAYDPRVVLEELEAGRDLLLQRNVLIPLLAKPVPRRARLHGEGEEEDRVGLGQADLGRPAPREVEALGRRVRDARVRVAIEDDRGAARQLALNLGPARSAQHHTPLHFSSQRFAEKSRCTASSPSAALPRR